MRARSLAVLLVLGLTGCDDGRDPSEPETFMVPVYDHGGDHRKNFGADANGSEEVPQRVTDAFGVAHFVHEGDSIRYRLAVRSIRNVTQAHIHAAPFGTNGGIVAWLYPAAPPATLIPGRSNGVIGSGGITDSEVIGVLAGTGVEGLLEALRSGDTYVNVHTSQFAGGEIRGQIQ